MVKGLLDRHDEERRILDLQELSWIHVGESWELRAGVQVEFWGVTEGVHLVNIINQQNVAAAIDQEEPLGQPMVQLLLDRPGGALELYLLPLSRRRPFPGEKGRLRGPVVIDVDHPRYASGARHRHVDWAIRRSWRHRGLDIALSHFSGTTREPRLEPRFERAPAAMEGEMAAEAMAQEMGAGMMDQTFLSRLIPVYETIDQTGLELQYSSGEWLWKLEAISRSGQGDRYTAADAGVEYTLSGIWDGWLDLGLLLEYLWDDRADDAPAGVMEHDWLLGMRLGFNDEASSEALLGMVWDPETEERLIYLEAARRLGSQWKASLEMRLFNADRPEGAGLTQDPDSKWGPWRDEDFVALSLEYYF